MSFRGIISADIKSRATRFQKEKKNFERQKDISSLLDLNGGNFRDWDKIDKYRINYDLLNGMLDVDLYDDPLCFEMGGEMISFDYQSVTHNPLISQIGNAIIGEQQNRVFRPTVKDNTPKRMTYFKKELQGRIQNYVDDTLNTKRQEIQQGIMQRTGISDIFSLPPEQQMELIQQTEEALKKDTPDAINEWAQYQFQTPTAKSAQKILDVLVEYHGIKHKDVIGFKHAVVTGEEYYYEGIRNNQLVFEEVNPTFFEWGGSAQEEWSHKGTWAKRENWYTYEDITTRHAEKLSERDLRELDFYHEPKGGVRDWQNFTTSFHKTIQHEYARDSVLQEKYKNLDIRNRAGQEQMIALYADIYGRDSLFSNRGGNNTNLIGYNSFGIREAHIVWRDKRILNKVKRNIDGKLKTFYVDEHYAPQAEDEEITKIWVDEVWEDYILGTWDQKHVGCQPVPHQYKSLDNPYNVDLPYYGKRYNTHDNLSKNVSLIDLGKTNQKDFDLTMASIKHDMATSFGTKFTVLFNMKPEEWSWQEWMDSVRNSPFILTDINQKGMNSFDMQYLKSINLSKTSEVAAKMGLAQMYRDELARAMYFNDARVGAIGQYATAQNTQTNQSASYNQTALFFEQHRLIMEKALGAFLNRARYWYKDNPEQAKVILDDISMAELMTGSYTSYQGMGITLDNSPAELEKIQVLKQQALPLIQNGASPEGVIRLIFADTQAEVYDIITKETKEIERKRVEELEAQQAQFQAGLQQKAESEEKDRQTDLQKHQMTNETKVTTAQIGAQVMANSQDIDKDGQSDLLEGRILELEQRAIEHRDKMILEREKNGVKT